MDGSMRANSESGSEDSTTGIVAAALASKTRKADAQDPDRSSDPLFSLGASKPLRRWISDVRQQTAQAANDDTEKAAMQWNAKEYRFDGMRGNPLFNKHVTHMDEASMAALERERALLLVRLNQFDEELQESHRARTSAAEKLEQLKNDHSAVLQRMHKEEAGYALQHATGNKSPDKMAGRTDVKYGSNDSQKVESDALVPTSGVPSNAQGLMKSEIGVETNVNSGTLGASSDTADKSFEKALDAQDDLKMVQSNGITDGSEGQRTAFEDDIQELTAWMNEDRSKLVAEVERLSTDLISAQKAEAAARRKIARLQSNNEIALAGLQQELEKEREENATAQCKIQEAEEEAAKLRSAQEEVASRLSDLVDEIENVKGAYSEAASVKESLQKELEITSCRLKEEKAFSGSLEDELVGSKRDVAQVEYELEQLQVLYEEVRNKWEEAKRAREDRDRELEELRGALGKQRTALAVAKKEAGELKTKMRNKELSDGALPADRAQTLRQDLAAIQQQLQANEMEYSQWRQEYAITLREHYTAMRNRWAGQKLVEADRADAAEEAAREASERAEAAEAEADMLRAEVQQLRHGS